MLLFDGYRSCFRILYGYGLGEKTLPVRSPKILEVLRDMKTACWLGNARAFLNPVERPCALNEIACNLKVVSDPFQQDMF